MVARFALLAPLLLAPSCLAPDVHAAGQAQLEQDLAAIDASLMSGAISAEEAAARARAAAEEYVRVTGEALLNGTEAALTRTAIEGGGIGSAFASLGLLALHLYRNRSRERGKHLPPNGNDGQET
jgi:hypothetical protein